MSYLGNEPQFTQYPSKFFNGDGTAMTVTLDYSPPNAAALLVFIDGVRQDTSAYTLSGTSMTFTGTVPSGTNNVQVVHLGLTQDVGVPSDDTISTVKIQDDAITSVKILDGTIVNADVNASAAIADTKISLGTAIQAYDANTAKTDVSQTWSATQNLADQIVQRPEIKDYAETVNAIGSIGGGTQDIDLESGNVVTGTVDTSTTTFTFSNPPSSGKAGSLTLILTNGGSQTVNWPGAVDWAGGTAPTLTSSGVDVITFTTVDGGTIWYGFAAGLDMS
jgi:hypothetical protein